MLPRSILTGFNDVWNSGTYYIIGNKQRKSSFGIIEYCMRMFTRFNIGTPLFIFFYFVSFLSYETEAMNGLNICETGQF